MAQSQSSVLFWEAQNLAKLGNWFSVPSYHLWSLLSSKLSRVRLWPFKHCCNTLETLQLWLLHLVPKLFALEVGKGRSVGFQSVCSWNSGFSFKVPYFGGLYLANKLISFKLCCSTLVALHYRPIGWTNHQLV